MSRLRPKTSSPTRAPLYVRSKGKVVEERKENTYAGAKCDVERERGPRSGHELAAAAPAPKYGKKNEPIKCTSRTRYLADTEPKPKTLATKRRNILAIRKPNASKTVLPTPSKTKALRRSADDAQTPSLLSAKLSKRSLTRSVREKRGHRCRAMASSSSEELAAAGTAPHPEAPPATKRRPFRTHSPSTLKKIRLKTIL